MDETTYADADDVTGDSIFEQSETTYDVAGNAILVTSRSRLHDATGSGELTTSSGSQPKARVSFLAVWSGCIQKTSGTTDLNQSREVNPVNELTNITETTGPSWITPAYDLNGNMTTVPQPADPTSSFTATYDPWNRLVKLVNTSTSDTVSEYASDVLLRRTTQKSYVSGTLDETRHIYYTCQWGSGI